MKNKNWMRALIILWGLSAISFPVASQECADVGTMEPTLDLIPFIYYAQPGENLESPWRMLPTEAFTRSSADTNGFNYSALGLDQWLR
ncbi:MAG: hypothetical protein KKD00_07765, partial [Gammaproteobacteria bacterium]|nr:hypothetical protein [Gammaproteobacteria bacterium]